MNKLCLTTLNNTKQLRQSISCILNLSKTTEIGLKTNCLPGNNHQIQRLDCFHSWSQRRSLLSRCRNEKMLNDPKAPIPARGFASQAGSGRNPEVKIPFWKRLTFVGAVGGIVAYSYYSINRDRSIREEEVRYEEFKKAELGGDWTLTDHHGKQRSSKEFRGQWVLMYFGFTHCPDICPDELEKLVKIVEYFDASSSLPQMMPIFISLDPDRDTPTVIKDYLADFKCPKLLGFTASSESTIREVATKYRAYFNKGIPDEDNDYIVDHTIIIYLVNPKGEFVNYFDRSKTADKIIKTVTEHINKYNELENREKH